MYVIALPDLHGDARLLPLLAAEFARADAVLLVGDLTTGGLPDPARHIVQTLRQHTKQVLAVCGNWDTQATAAYLSAEGINLEDGPHTLGDVTFFGVGGSLGTGAGSPNEYTEAVYAARFATLQASVLQARCAVIVCHQPPFRTLCDRAQFGQHVGSLEVRRFLERTRPLACVTGHIHEGIGVDKIGRTTVVNPGPLWMGGYATLHIDDGELHANCCALPPL